VIQRTMFAPRLTRGELLARLAALRQAEEPVSQLINDFGPPVATST
jgi:hypothetical protein